jgi:hypothetical protein
MKVQTGIKAGFNRQPEPPGVQVISPRPVH